MSAAAELRSDHLNYLIYRYLQEFGHEKTARAFYRDWHRPVEHDDPESFPFAHAVQRNDLVSVIQDGLHHDELLARVRQCERRFRWTNFDARDSVERQDGLIENGAGSRPPSRNRRKPRIPGHIRGADDFIMPAAKRPRRSEGSQAQINGDRDAMDVDAASASADAEDENDLASPTGASELEGAESVVRYDSMEVGTQTDRTKTSTMHWKIDQPGVHISHCIWNPSGDAKNGRCLLAVGSSLCRFYQLPSSVDSDAQEITHADVSLQQDSVVTTAAWRPDGSAASCAIDGSKELPDGSKVSSQFLVEYSRDSGSLPFQPGPSLLESPGIVLQLRYSPTGRYLLQARYHHHNRGSLQVWKTPKTSAETLPGPREPLARSIFEQPVNDACWIAEDAFLVCGAEGLSSVYEMAEHDATIKDEDSEAVKLLYSLVERRANLVEERIELDKVRFDQRHGLAVFTSTESKRLVMVSTTVASDEIKEAKYVLDLPGQPSDLHFRPSHTSDTEAADADDISQPSYLAVAFEDRGCIVYGISRSPGSGIACNELASLSMIDGPALALSWSPNGHHLAVSSADLVQIWHTDALRRKNSVRHTADPLITWRRPAEANGIPNGTHEEQTATQSEPSLSWSADGERLAFAVDQRIAVIRFRPPLNPRDTPNAEPNGRPTP